ncbi:hypothetical protein MTP99_000982 [Tenebrio molitor]|jgi:integrase|nr:hypothetical protein MTP99_000982 [Tenebrio molitor]CAH1369752.1 unnamed protein product [Tenebrio molitor]
MKMEIFVPEDVLEEAQEVAGNLLPAKSREKYEKQFAHFVTWRKARGVRGTNEDILLAYFRTLSDTCVGSSLWCKYSMLKSTLKIEEKEDISRFSKLQAFLKRKSSNHRAKKANVLEITHIDKFLGEADNNEYLMMKIVLIMGIFGACRCDELVKMSVDDVTEVGTYLSIDIPMTKTDKPRRFVIVKEGCSADPIALYQKYISLRPANIKHNRLFLRYANGKCTVQPVGINKIASIPSVIASYLKLEHPETYTGHSLRRSSTTLLAEGGADVINLKRHGGWRSSKTAEEYVADSNNSKIKIAKTIIGINRSSFNDLPG